MDRPKLPINSETYRTRFLVLLVVIFVIVGGLAFIVSISSRDVIISAITNRYSLFFVTFIGIMYTVILLVSTIIHMHYKIENRYVKELKNFKSFFDTLYQTSTENEVYKVLYDSLRTHPLVDEITMFYNTNTSEEDNANTYQKLTSTEVQLCNLIIENCPALVKGNEFCVDSIAAGHGLCPYQLPDYKVGSYACFPIASWETDKNIVQLYSRREHSFKPSVISGVKSYIEIAGSILNIKKTMYSLTKNATTDKLTNLYNRNFLEPYLENQIEAANLSNQQISAIMVDMDHFKLINDNYGHSVGDYVLTVFAQLILKCVRKTDMVARVGGDEFIVVLPSTRTETAEVIAERIRREVAEARIPPYNGIVIPPISCSVGVSTYPVFCDSKDSLIRTSDVALYNAKQAGRNCIRTYFKNAFNV